MSVQYLCKFGIPNQYFKEQLISLRKEVFIQEKGMYGFPYMDDYDINSLQIYSLDNNKLIGNSRSRHIGGGTWKIERVCVDKNHRSDGIGSKMIYLLEREIKKKDGKELVLSSQHDADYFYEKKGYYKQGNYFKYFGVPHVDMKKKINKEN